MPVHEQDPKRHRVATAVAAGDAGLRPDGPLHTAGSLTTRGLLLPNTHRAQSGVDRVTKMKKTWENIIKSNSILTTYKESH